MAFLQAKDTINGQEGRAYATIGGEVEEMFYIKSLEASAEKQKTDVKTLGRRGTQHKAAGWTGSGTMTIYYVTSRFRQMMLDYIRDGIDTYFDIQITNEDPASSIGKQTVTLLGVNLNKVFLSKLNTDSATLDEEVEFTFEDVEITDQFADPILG